MVNRRRSYIVLVGKIHGDILLQRRLNVMPNAFIGFLFSGWSMCPWPDRDSRSRSPSGIAPCLRIILLRLPAMRSRSIQLARRRLSRGQPLRLHTAPDYPPYAAACRLKRLGASNIRDRLLCSGNRGISIYPLLQVLRLRSARFARDDRNLTLPVAGGRPRRAECWRRWRR